MSKSKLRLYSVSAGETQEVDPVEMSKDEWKERLSPDAYRVLRKKGTERAFTDPLNDNKADGVYRCAGCGTDLFLSGAKFDSGTGWPSFYQPVHDANVGSEIDSSFFMRRTEVHCGRCGGHLGHVFPDGPEPTGQRYCINGVSLNFKADQETDTT